jgi:hypothetical protein
MFCPEPYLLFFLVLHRWLKYYYTNAIPVLLVSPHNPRTTQNMSDESDSDEPLKKRPGRPKKYATRPPVKREGVVDKPSNHAEKDQRTVNVMELVYDNPLLFKRLFTMFKGMGVEQIRMRFDKDQVKMHAEDHIKVSDIFVRIQGKDLVRYYCDHPYEVGLPAHLLHKILQTFTRDYPTIQFSAEKRTEGTMMLISFMKEGGKQSSLYTVNVDTVKDWSWDIENRLALEDEYPVKFQLDCRFYKKKVTDGKTLADTLRFEKKGTGNLQMRFDFTGGKGRHDHNFLNPEEIKLQSTLVKGQNVIVPVCIEYLKPLASAVIASNVSISICTDKDIIFTYYLDQDDNNTEGSHRCVVKVITKCGK